MVWFYCDFFFFKLSQRMKFPRMGRPVLNHYYWTLNDWKIAFAALFISQFLCVARDRNPIWTRLTKRGNLSKCSCSGEKCKGVVAPPRQIWQGTRMPTGLFSPISLSLWKADFCILFQTSFFMFFTSVPEPPNFISREQIISGIFWSQV